MTTQFEAKDIFTIILSYFCTTAKQCIQLLTDVHSTRVIIATQGHPEMAVTLNSYFYAATVGELLSRNSHLNHFTNFGVPPKFAQCDMPCFAT